MYIYPLNFSRDLSQILFACKKDNKLNGLLRFSEFMPNLIEKTEEIDSQNWTINLMLDNLDDFVNFDRMAPNLGLVFKEGLVADRYLTLINKGKLNFFWMANMLKDLLPEFTILVCGVIQQIQLKFVEHSQIRGDDRVEIAFR